MRENLCQLLAQEYVRTVNPAKKIDALLQVYEAVARGWVIDGVECIEHALNLASNI